MKFYTRIQKFCAVSLIVIFTMQAGLGLWLHNTFHHSSVLASQSGANSNLPVVQPGSSFACSCVDDFLVPFIVVKHLEVLPPIPVFFSQPAFARYDNVSSSSQVFRPLRAPPMHISF